MSNDNHHGAESGPAIRAYEAGDEAGVIALLDDTFHSTWAPELTPQALEKQLRDRPAEAYVRESGPEFLVAVEDGVVLGMVHWRDDFIHALHVLGAAHRRGIGRRLLARAEAAIAASHDRIRLETDTFNAKSRAFYGAQGYRETDFYPDEEWDSGLTTVLLEKTLR